jgi:hypothetical protein
MERNTGSNTSDTSFKKGFTVKGVEPAANNHTLTIVCLTTQALSEAFYGKQYSLKRPRTQNLDRDALESERG